ncbi:MAG: hypothetical protein RL033_2275 [Pseudomonadota bacterium]|jgi:chromosome segregation ATPase
MSTLFKDRQNVVSFAARRGEPPAVDGARLELDVMRRELERDRATLTQERQQLEKERAEFEDDLSVLEDQRHFLDTQREKLRLDIEAFDLRRGTLARGYALDAQKLRVENVLEDARKSREGERARLQSEMAGLLQQRAH